MTLSKPLSLFTILILISALLSLSFPIAAASGQLSRWIPTEPVCRGTIGDCLLTEEDEFGLDSETNRRILATKKYISYGALKRNTVPCSRRGASYYNCKKGAQANPYSRGCSAITRCRS